MFIHHRDLTRERVLRVIERHQGRDAAVRIGGLVFEAINQPSDSGSERKVRRLISELRLEGVAICGHPDAGYWLAANDAELDECCDFLRSRALHSLTVLSRMRKVALPQLLNQMSLEECDTGRTFL